MTGQDKSDRVKTIFVALGFVDIVLGVLMVLFGASVLGLDRQVALLVGIFLVIMGVGPIAVAMFLKPRR